MHESTRETVILKTLTQGPQSHTQLALLCECPSPSIRRLVQSMRRKGHNISFGDDGTYRLFGNPLGIEGATTVRGW